MFASVLLILAATPDLAELKLERSYPETSIIRTLANGLVEVPLSRWSTKYPVSELDGAARAALTTQALTEVKAFLETPGARATWKRFLTDGYDAIPGRSASLAADVAYWTTLNREKKGKDPGDAMRAERATQALAAFKKDRPRLEKEASTRAKAAAAADDAAFKEQLIERLTYFLSESKSIPFDAKLEELPNGKKRFADKVLEAKPSWWKFCFRAGPEATKAARDFATAWLAELKAPPSPAKLSDDR